MRKLIKNLLKLQVIAYYNNTRNHANSCYRDIEDIGKIESYNACLRQGCQNINFCMQINHTMKELNKKEYDEVVVVKECEHDWIEVDGNILSSSNPINKLRCTKCGVIKWV